jgi:hypothetical protein
MADINRKPGRVINITIEGDLDQTINFGHGNKVNGEMLSDVVLPDGAEISETGEGEVEEDLAELIRRTMSERFNEVVGSDVSGGINIRGKSNGAVIIQGNGQKVNYQKERRLAESDPSLNNSPSEPDEKLLPYRAGFEIGDSHIGGEYWKGTYVLVFDPVTGQPLKRDNQFVYRKK